MNRAILAALGLWILLGSMLVAPVAAHDAKASASVAVDCDANLVRVTFKTEADEVTYMVLAGDAPVVDKTTVDVDGQTTVEIPLLDDGDYVLVFDPENVIDNSFEEVPFTVDCPRPTPTPEPSDTPPPTTPPTNPPTFPPHKTVPPSDTAPLAVHEPSGIPDGLLVAFLALVVASGASLWTIRRRRA